jgi:hypothetical protein
VTKLNAAGSALVYSTYLGGTSEDVASALAVDSAGNAYVAGRTYSGDFPTANPLQASVGGDVDGFVTKLNASGSALVYSTYLGGGYYDIAMALAVDSAGNAYVAGRTGSGDFPTANPFQASPKLFDEAFVTKLNASGSGLVYSTYLGGTQNEFASAIAVDAAGNAYVAGQTYSLDFPTANPIQANHKGGLDAFVTKLNASGSALVYSTYAGGGLDDYATALAVDGAGNAYVAGAAESNDFPTANPLQASRKGDYDAFVLRLDAATPSVSNTTLLEGTGGSNSAVLTVTLGAAPSFAITVPYTTADGTAVAGQDYTATSGTLTFPAGTTTQMVSVPIATDSLYEADETLELRISGVSGTATIQNDDEAPSLSIASASSSEGTGGEKSLSFTVSLSAVSGRATTVNYATSGGTASAMSDYATTNGTLTLPAGNQTGTIAVPLATDRIFEADETFTLTLSSPSGATLGTAAATGTIQNDDAPGFSVDDAGGREGFSNLVFTVTLSPPVAAQTTVAYATANGTATAGSDYTAASGTLTFAANETTKTVTVTVGPHDATPELAETFTTDLSDAMGTTIGSPQGTGTITDSSRPVGDLGGDYKTDLLWRKTGAGVDKGAVFLWTMNGTGLAGARYLDPISEDWQVQFMGDFNGDGKSDVLWRNTNGTLFGGAGRLYIWMMDGPNVAGGTGYTASQADLGWRVDGVGDLNGDGKDDIVWRKTGAGVDKGAVFLWTMNGTGLAGARYLDPISEDWQVVDIGDFNGDGKADVLWRNMNNTSPDAGNLYIWMMDGANVIGGTGYTAAQADLGWRVDGVGDLNGDGKDDIVWRKIGEGVDKGAVFLWTMNGTGLAGARHLDPITEDWQVQGLGDFNGDGKTDILWRNQGPGGDAGNLYIWMMDGPNVIGGTGYTAAQADLGWRIDSPRK